MERGEQSPSRKGAAGDTSDSFHAFLSRQNKMETDKLKHIEHIQVRVMYRTYLLFPPLLLRLLCV